MLFFIVIIIILQENPEVVDMMLQKLADYAADSLPPFYPPVELELSDPSKHGDAWKPWH